MHESKLDRWEFNLDLGTIGTFFQDRGCLLSYRALSIAWRAIRKKGLVWMQPKIALLLIKWQTFVNWLVLLRLVGRLHYCVALEFEVLVVELKVKDAFQILTLFVQGELILVVLLGHVFQR